MNCKNCKNPLQKTDKFCAMCGAKVINHRLNFKTITSEFFVTFISWDNKFFKTFIHLITKPQVVANGYLDGVRKRYMQPFAYMVIALTLYGIYMYYAKDILVEYMNSMQESMDMLSKSDPNSKMQENPFKNIMPILTKYHNIITFASIPFLAMINNIIFKRRNYIEHNIALLYVYASFLIFSTILGFIGIAFHIPYDYLYVVIMIMMVLYHMYFYKKMFHLDVEDTILKTLFFWLLMIPAYIIIIVIGVVIYFFSFKFGIIPK